MVTKRGKQVAAAAAAAKSLQSCLTLCDPIDGSLGLADSNYYISGRPIKSTVIRNGTWNYT